MHYSGFADWHSWDKTGYFAPKSTHAPVAHAMDTNMFNGRINVFVHGTDGKIHHIWQTTCDKVPNPWGWCTWSTWNTIGGSIPLVMNTINTLAIANNMHLGIEVTLWFLLEGVRWQALFMLSVSCQLAFVDSNVPFSHSIKQSTHQLLTQPYDHSISQSLNALIGHSISQQFDQPFIESTHQLFTQSSYHLVGVFLDQLIN